MHKVAIDVDLLKEIKMDLAKLYSRLKSIDAKISRCCGKNDNFIPVVDSKKVK